MRRSLAIVLGLLAAACGGNGVTSPPAPAASPVVNASPAPPVRAACSDGMAGPASLPQGASVAVLATDERELTLFLVDDLSGCWIRLDDSEAPSPLSRLAAHPGGHFVFASGEVASGRAGVAAYAIVPERAMIDGLGASWMEEHSFDLAGSMAVTGDAVYMLSGGPHTGQHGGMWRWAFDAGDGGLTWRGVGAAARDPFFLERSTDRRFVYLGTETLDDSGFGDALRVLRVGQSGALNEVASISLAAQSTVAVDPAGRFVWVATPFRTARLRAYRPTTEGPLAGPVSEVEWSRPAPLVHPSGQVLYSATATQVEAYVVDLGTGALRLVAQVPFAGADRQRLAVDPNGRFLYAISSSEVHAFRTAVPSVQILAGDPLTYLEEFGRVGPGGSQAVLVRVP